MEQPMNGLPWIVSFSFARSIQQPALDTWKAQDTNIHKAQKLLYQWAKLDIAAKDGTYSSDIFH